MTSIEEAPIYDTMDVMQQTMTRLSRPSGVEATTTEVAAQHPEQCELNEKVVIKDEPHMQYYTLYGIAPTSTLRLRARWLIRKVWFEKGIDLCIVMNCICLALRDPLADACTNSRDGATNAVLTTLDVAFTIIFVAELCLKLVVHGLARHPGAYLLDGWNWIDGFVVATSVLGFFPDPFCVYLSGLSALRAVRLMRKPLTSTDAKSCSCQRVHLHAQRGRAADAHPLPGRCPARSQVLPCHASYNSVAHRCDTQACARCHAPRFHLFVLWHPRCPALSGITSTTLPRKHRVSPACMCTLDATPSLPPICRALH